MDWGAIGQGVIISVVSVSLVAIFIQRNLNRGLKKYEVNLTKTLKEHELTLNKTLKEYELALSKSLKDYELLLKVQEARREALSRITTAVHRTHRAIRRCVEKDLHDFSDEAVDLGRACEQLEVALDEELVDLDRSWDQPHAFKNGSRALWQYFNTISAQDAAGDHDGAETTRQKAREIAEHLLAQGDQVVAAIRAAQQKQILE